MSQRFGIIGTAQSWTMAPWQDGGIVLAGLNDAYQLKLPRADEWYDMHPMDKFWHPPQDKPIGPADIPVGHYLRPGHHLDWLEQFAGPVWLHPDHEAQCPRSAAWTHGRVFPRRAIEDHFGQYFVSTPAWMFAHAILRGFRDIEIYGIHLATQVEYTDQRPNFEFLIGRLLGAGRVTMTVRQGLRRYETQDGAVTLPASSPVLQMPYQYGFEMRPKAALAPLEWDVHRYGVKRERAVEALKRRPWWKRIKSYQEALINADVDLRDARETLHHAAMALEATGAASGRQEF